MTLRIPVQIAIGILALCTSSALFGQDAKRDSSATPSPQQPVRLVISEKVARKLLVKKVQPRYPAIARQNHAEGQVVLKAVISKAGDVSELSVIVSQPFLTDSAAQAVKQWKFKPYLLNGEPVEVETRISVDYTISIQ
jgi:protein TonB